MRIHDEYYKVSLLQIKQQFGTELFDCVLASDIIGNFPEDEVLDLFLGWKRLHTGKLCYLSRVRQW